MTTRIGTATANARPVPLPNLTYHGGKILKSPTFVPIFLGAHWGTLKGGSERSYITEFCRKIPRSDYTSVWKEYGVGKGSCGTADTVSPKTARRRVTDRELQTLVQAEIGKKRVQSEDGETVYTVFLPPGMVLVTPDGHSTSLDGVGGYHSSYNTPDGGKVYYAAIVYSQGENGISFTDDPKDNITITTSHEWTEAATDPDVNNGKLGWYDYQYGEVSDIPLSMGMPPEEIIDAVDGFAVQENWSNKDGRVEAVSNDRETKRAQ